jgi:transcriptional regulator with XRE-family HTH domain
MPENQNGLWAAYVRAVTGDVPAQAISDKIAERVGEGVSQPTVSRWLAGKNSGELKPGNVAAFATAYDRPVLQAFLAAGLLTANQVGKGLTRTQIAFVLELEPPPERRDITKRRRASQ